MDIEPLRVRSRHLVCPTRRSRLEKLDETPGVGRRPAQELIAEIGVTMTGTLGEIVAGLARTDTFLSVRYRRLARRRGKKRAIVAVGNSVLTIIWHILSDTDTRYHDLGPDYHESRFNKQRRQRDLVRQLEHLTGPKVTLHPGPDLPAAA